MKILFLVPYPLGESPSQRFRFEQYFIFLSRNGISYKVSTFLSQKWKLFFEKGKLFSKLVMLISGFARRFSIILRLSRYDFVFIHREAAPIGPPLVEWIIAKVFRKRVIYDFDDAIWLTDKTNESRIEKIIRWRKKVSQICKWSYKVSAGNQYLADFAKQFNKDVRVNPTTIDLSIHDSAHYSKPESSDKIIIGWTGSHSTLKYLKKIEGILQRIEEKYPSTEVWVIADKTPELNIPRFYFRPWSLKTEISDLARFDIGIMSLPNDEWTKGKCGFKALQYMAMGIPTIASAVGVNASIIDHGVNGYLVSNDSEWELYLTTLIENEVLSKQIGAEGKKTVEQYYSVETNLNNYLSLFDE